MIPYAANIVNTMQGENVYAIFVSKGKRNYHSILEKNDRYVFIEIPDSKWRSLLFKLFPFTLIWSIKKICKKEKIDIVHLLTGEFVLARYMNLFLNKDFKLLYTVHDAMPHAINVNFKTRFFFHTPAQMLIKKCPILITNSEEQKKYLQTHFTGKHIYFHRFPSLITDSIVNGDLICDEIIKEKDYILFFGSIHHYKGVDLLYDTYLANPELQKSKLVIAGGGGGIYFNRNINRENNNVIVINRFIKEEEIKSLFENAKCVVYPYRKITQSGVISLAYLFSTPLLVSDLPYFKNLIIEEKTALSFKHNDSHSLSEQLETLLKKTDFSLMKIEQQLAYQKFFSKEGMKVEIESIYNYN
jgi:glycosyltransferase involved in cell wall biosynthesis